MTQCDSVNSGIYLFQRNLRICIALLVTAANVPYNTKRQHFCFSVVRAETTEDVAGAAESVQNLGAPPRAVSPPSQERGSYKKLGLTKEVLAAHTQKEEQAFLYRIKERRGLAALQVNCSHTLDHQRDEITTDGTTKHQFALLLIISTLICLCSIKTQTKQHDVVLHK